MRNKPRIRFKGFTEDWEQRKLGDFTNQINTFVNPEDAKLPLWSLTAEAGLIEKSDRYERDFLVKKKDQFKRIENNTLVYNPMNITIGSIDIYTGLYPIAVSGYYVSIVYDKNIDTDFLKEVLLLPSSLKMYKNYATGSLIERQRVQYPTFSKLQLLLPNLDEQKAIGQFFKSLNLDITLHQRKLEKLKLAKKALLQKLFPKNGSQFPEIRFKGFTDAWEQRKLSDITEIVMGQSPSSKNYTDNPNDNILVQGNADLKDGKVVPRLWTKEITKTIDKDGIILTVRAPVGDVAKTDYKVVLGRGVAGIKGNDYIYQFLQKLQNNRYWVSLSSGSTFESINSNDIKDLIIDIPSIEEQTKISMLLNNVNSIITLHQRKLDKLQEVKKGLLQKMFV